MVATSGRGWRLAPCLKALFDEADKRKPSRSHASDGSIGNAEHSARDSDHNPDGGWVCAGDVDDDDDSEEVDVDLLIAHLVASKDRRCKLLIRNGTIWKSYANRGLPPWTPQVYTGPNAHDHHGHVSVHNTAEARNDLRPWWPQHEEGFLAALTEKEQREILTHLRHLDPFPPEKLNTVGEKDAGGKPASRTIRWAAESLDKLRRL